MLIVFTQTRRLSEDGHKTRRFHTGKTYDVARSAACYALNNGWARQATHEEMLAYAVAQDAGA